MHVYLEPDCKTYYFNSSLLGEKGKPTCELVRSLQQKCISSSICFRVSSLFPQCLLGVAYSLLACALWPMVAFVVPEHQLGTAYGL